VGRSHSQAPNSKIFTKSISSRPDAPKFIWWYEPMLSPRAVSPAPALSDGLHHRGGSHPNRSRNPLQRGRGVLQGPRRSTLYRFPSSTSTRTQDRPDYCAWTITRPAGRCRPCRRDHNFALLVKSHAPGIQGPHERATTVFKFEARLRPIPPARPCGRVMRGRRQIDIDQRRMAGSGPTVPFFLDWTKV